MCGASTLSHQQRQQLSDTSQWLFDDQGINISHDNIWLGDLTGLYWIWRNTTDAWVGTNQYRRFYDDQTLASLVPDDRTVWVSQYIQFPYSLAHQYRSCHNDMGLHVLWQAAKLGKIPLSVGQVESLDRINSISPCNMFFAGRAMFDRVCEILFETIFELLAGTRYCLPYVQIDPAGKQHTRMLAYLAERILTLIYHDHRHFLGDSVIVPIPYQTYDH